MAANSRAVERQDTLDQWHAARKIAARFKQVGKRVWRPDRDQIGDLDRAGWLDGVKADGRTGRGVPDKARTVPGEDRCYDQPD
jgi:hypothetical protein